MINSYAELIDLAELKDIIEGLNGYPDEWWEKEASSVFDKVKDKLPDFILQVPDFTLYDMASVVGILQPKNRVGFCEAMKNRLPDFEMKKPHCKDDDVEILALLLELLPLDYYPTIFEVINDPLLEAIRSPEDLARLLEPLSPEAKVVASELFPRSTQRNFFNL